MWREIAAIGRQMVALGITHSTMGNISARVGDMMLITRKGADLGKIREDSVLHIPINGTEKHECASVEAPVHRRIYQLTDAKAVVHAHPAHAVALSISMRGQIKPLDIEGALYLGEVPVTAGEPGSETLAENVALALKARPAVIVRGHGAFTKGSDLASAFNLQVLLEHSCRVRWLTATLRR
ncbi:MAG: aldolase [Candidatus Thermoplasmatota archaeon]